MISSVFVSNQRSAYKPVQGAVTMIKTISTTAIVAKTDTQFTATTPLHADAEVLLVQNVGNDVYMTMHGETPAANAGILLVANSIIEMSRSQWLASKWIRSTADATLVVCQLRAS